MILQTVRQFIAQEQLFTYPEKILVALSGGADSVALLRILMHLGYPLEAAHCNFHLRGAESQRDMEFVVELCGQHGVFLHAVDFDTTQFARQKGISIEMAARELRYTWFEKISRERHLDKIAVAHHRDDSVETVLLNLIRGTGIAGLTGIKPIHGKIVRPLLGLARADLIAYLDSLGQTFVTDSSNQCEDYTRNKIRHSVLPLLETLNPSVRKGLWQTARHLAQVETVYRTAIKEAMPRVFTSGRQTQSPGLHEGVISVTALLQEPSPAALLHEILSPYGFVPAQVKDIYRSLYGESGRKFRSGSWTLLKDREELIVYCDQETEELPEICIQEVLYHPEMELPRDPSIACIDAARVKNALRLRKSRQGDRFIPLGMQGRKRVRDFLTDRKKNLREKEEQLVLTDGDEIVWVVGERLDDRYKVTENTRQLFVIRLKQSPEKKQ